MNTEIISTIKLTDKPDGSVSKSAVLAGEIESVFLEYYSFKGAYQINEPANSKYYDVLLSLQGVAALYVGKDVYEFNSNYIVRIPFNEPYRIQLEKRKEFHFLRIRKYLDDNDRGVILQNPDEHSFVYIESISKCPVYTEEIKSDKTINRMILPEGFVPRFCMGSVYTEGPDSVEEHEHAMLDQLFLGLKNCRCTCSADGEQAELTENMILHIPLGSKHSVSVRAGDTLYYIWLDFFLTQEGQKYMGEQHHMDDE